MAKAKRRSSEASNQSPRTARPLYIALLILGLIVTAIAFVLVPTTIKGMCLATAAFLVWQLLRVTGRL
jgi:Flp pilus assembly protein TadB